MDSHEVTMKDLLDLLNHFENNPFEATACEPGSLESAVLKKCEHLFRYDYSVTELDNTAGQLCPRYPGRIFIPESEHGHMAATITASTVNILSSSTNSNSSSSGFVSGSGTGDTGNGSNSSSNGSGNGNSSNGSGSVSVSGNLNESCVSLTGGPMPLPQPPQQPQRTIYEDLYDMGRIRELITTAKYARCRQRFVVPVILYRGKYICRSATISVPQETFGRKVFACAYDYLNGTNYGERGGGGGAGHDGESNDGEDSLMTPLTDSIFNYSEVIRGDVQLLHALNVNTIVDLMVEKRKIKFFLPVSSSEKADPENQYTDFNIMSLPYPGCEFFQKFRDNNYMAKNLRYDWTQPLNDADIGVPKTGPHTELDIRWDEYKNWDVVLLTQNYLKATLKYIQEDNAGLLVHCISGWDRTPLFISLVRLSLWADGLIHQSLNALQITYFTIAYDWFLFGHQLTDRLKRGEEIMFFCFHVLKFIMDDEFSVVEHRKRTKTPSSGSSSVSIIKQDDESPFKEDLLLCLDEGSNDSFTNCDIQMNEAFFAVTAPTTPTTITAPTTTLTSRSPNSKRVRTSPISVPGASATARQRYESTSSNGSWQVVTETGSIDSMATGSFMKGNCSDHSSNGSDHSTNTSNGSNGASPGRPTSSTAQGSPNSITATDTAATIPTAAPNTATKPPRTIRYQRLNAVRAIFIQGYGKTVGLQFREGTTMATFISTIF